MKKRDYFDYSDLLSQGEEVFGETLRRAFDYDSYGGKRKFPAIVLTPPVPMTARQAGLFTRANRPKDPLTREELFAGPDAALNKLDKFSFRGRIIGPNSPHAFLPDPCQYIASDTPPPDTQFKLTAMHTLFVSSDDYQIGTGEIFPTKGCVVLVELDENQFGYNLEIGTFINVLSKTNTYYNVEKVANENCLSPLAALDFSGNLDNITFGPARQLVYIDPSTGEETVISNGSPPPELLQSVDPTYADPALTILKVAAPDFNNLAKAYFERFKKKLRMTGGMRTIEGQKRAKKEWCAKGDCGNAATPGTSNHGFGVAVDIGDGTGFDGESFKWLKANCQRFNWEHPYWARPKSEGGKNEPWHFEWIGRKSVFRQVTTEPTPATT